MQKTITSNGSQSGTQQDIPQQRGINQFKSCCIMPALFLLMLLLGGMMSFGQGSQTFTSSGTFTVPSNVALVSVSLWGGGGGGGGGGTGYASGGGGAGGSFTNSGTILVTPGSAITVTVGTGGAGGAAATNGTVGGTSTFPAWTSVNAIGGAGGFTAGSLGHGAGGGVTTGVTWNGGAGGNYNINYGGGGGGGAGSSGSGGNGGQPTGGTAGSGSGGTGGTGGIVSNTAGTNGNSLSGGGGGGGGVHSGTAFAGGNGADGQVIVTWVTCSTNLNAYNVTGGGSYCTGGSGVDIGLDGSQNGVDYQLLFNGVPTGSPIAGTGGVLDFNNQTTAGTYTIVGYSTTSSCGAVMTGSAVVSINALPTAGITGTTTGCGSVSLTASGGSSYAWSGGNSTATAANSFTSSGTYAVSVTNNNCTATASANVTVNSLPTAGITGTTTGCSSVSLTATGGTSYAWSGGSSASSATNSFTATGTYTVTVTGSDNCAATTSASVTVNAYPATPVISAGSATTFCNGGTVTLTATNPPVTDLVYYAGSYTSAPANDQWQSFVPTVAGLTSLIEVRAFVGGTQSATFNLWTGVGNGGTLLNTQALTLTNVDGWYTIYLPNLSLTPGNNYTIEFVTAQTFALEINFNGEGFANYGTYYSNTYGANPGFNIDLITYIEPLVTATPQWYNGANAINGATSTTYSASTNGSYTVNATSNGCTSTNSNAISVTVNSLPTAGITGTTTGCGSVSLTATGGTSYAWSGGNSTNTAANTFTSSGTYTVTVTNSNNCTATASTSVTVNSFPTAGITGSMTGCISVSLTATGGTTYAWSGGNSTATAANSFTSSATYIVSVTNSNNCTSTTSASVTVNSATVITSCQSNITQGNDAGQCSAVVNYSGTTATGTPSPTYTYAPASGSTFNVGTTTTVICTATNTCGTATCSFTVTVNDNEAPVISGCTNITQNNDNNNCSAVVTFTTPSATDNCGFTLLGSNTFNYTAGIQNYTIPANVTSITVKAWGAGGGGGGEDGDSGGPGGGGAYSTSVLSVTPGAVMKVYVGGGGSGGTGCVTNTGQGGGGFGYGSGASGGAAGGTGCSGGGAGGGGGTALVNSSNSALVVAGGGGGGGGAGNDVTAAAGGAGGVGGSNSSQATGGSSGTSGTINGASGSSRGSGDGGAGGGGGGGLLGGSGGGAPGCDCSGAGGGGGTSLGTATNGSGVTPGNNSALNPICSSCSFGGAGRPGNSNGSGITGGNGVMVISYNATSTTLAQVPQTGGHVSGYNYPVGTTTNTYLATDIHGNTSTCSFTVTVHDNQSPVITSPGNQTVNMSAGNCTGNYTIASPVNDNCPSSTTWGYSTTGVTSLSSSGIAEGTGSGSLTFNKGVTTVTLSGTDGTNSAATHSFTLTVTDNQAPVITNPGNQTVNTGAGICTGNYTINSSINDNCPGSTTWGYTTTGVTTLSASGIGEGTGSSSLTFNRGVTTVTLSGSDGTNNAATTSFTITVTDNQAPTLTSPGNQTFYTPSNSCESSYTIASPINDNCPSSATWGYNLTGVTSGTASGIAEGTGSGAVFFNNGITTVTLSGTDGTNNATTTSFRVTVIDNVAPVLSACPNSVTVNNDNNNCSALVNFSAPTATDNCAGGSNPDPSAMVLFNGNLYYLDGTNGVALASGFQLGTNAELAAILASNPNAFQGKTYYSTVSNNCCVATADALENYGMNANCNAPGTFSANQPIFNGGGGCNGANLHYSDQLSFFIGPGGPAISQTTGHPSGYAFPLGTTTNTFMATDQSGNTATCSFTVTVVDNQPPVITCASNVTHNTDQDQCNANVTVVSPTYSDNCSLGNALAFNGSNNYVNAGNASSLQLTGNMTVEAWINVAAFGGPDYQNTIVGKEEYASSDHGFALRCGGFGQLTFNVANTNNTWTASESNPYTLSTGTWYHVAGTYDGSHLNLYVNGNLIVSQSKTGGIANSSNPLYIGDSPADLTRSFNGTIDEIRVWNVARTQAQIQASINTTIPAQSGLVLNYRFDQGVAGGDNTAITSATDNSGLGNNGILHAFTMTGNTSNFVSGSPSVVTDVTLTNSFNGTANASGSYNTGTTTVTWTATDAHGNTSTCSQTVTVQDHQAPTISSCPSAQTAFANGNCQASVPIFTSGVVATDNCTASGSLVITQSPSASSLANTGVTTLTLTVADVAGNTSTCSTTFTVIDNTPPVISCNNSNTTVNNDNNNCSAVVTYTTPTATDNCSSVSSGTLTFSYTGSIVNWTAPSTGIYTIKVSGAQGGSATPWNGGLGAQMIGDFSFSSGDNLVILAGQKGSNGVNNGSTYFGGAGGGGSFVTKNGTLILAAGGGGGAGSGELGINGIARNDNTGVYGWDGNPGLTTTTGNVANGVVGNGYQNGTPGSNGNGGTGGNYYAGSGGGGYLTNGGNSTNGNTSHGGFAFVNGGAGGAGGNYINLPGPNGGFGGGGGAVHGGGGGGGYSGGAGGTHSANYSATAGGGGGSYNSGNNQTNTPNVNAGDGIVIINYNITNGLAITQTSGYGSGYSFPIGTTTNTFLATDASNNTSTCSFTVTVVDNQAPVMGACPSNITQCNHVLSYSSPTATDNCSATVSCSPASGTTVNAGITTVVCTATDPAGNTATCSFTVTVADLTIGITETDNSGTTANDGVICNGFSAGLDAGVHAAYSWSNGSTFESFTVSPTTTSTYTVTISNGQGCTGSVSQTITVKSNPSASSSVTTPIACNAGNGVITVSATGGTTPYTGTGANTVIQGGPYSYTVTDVNGCTANTSQSISQPTQVVFTTVVTNNSSCTTAHTASIAVTASGGTGVKTYSDNGGSTYQGAALFSALANGTYTVKVKDANSCTSIASNIVITTSAGITFTTTIVNATTCTAPNGKITVLAVGGDGFYNYSKDGGTTYQSSNIFTSLLHGTYSIKVKDAVSCMSNVTTAAVGPNCQTRLEDNSVSANSNSFNVYPNPARDEVTILFSSTKEEEYNIRLMDVTGRIVIDENQTAVIGDNQFQMNVSELAKGIYMVILQNSDGMMEKKIVVQ